MKSLIFKLILVTIIIGSSPSQAQPENSPTLIEELGQLFTTATVPDNKSLQYVELETPDGHPRILPQSDKNLMLVNYWASWRGYCVVELPNLIAFQKKHPEIDIMYIGDDKSSTTDLRKMMQKLEMPTDKTLFDSRGFFKRAMKLRALPATMVVDKKGRILYYLEGSADWDSPIIQKMLEGAEKRAKESETIQKNS